MPKKFCFIKSKFFRGVMLLSGLALAAMSHAHPLGNNTVNRQAAIHLRAEALELRYLMDWAEIPTLGQTQAADIDQDGDTSPAEWDAYTKRWASEIASRLRLNIDRQPLMLQLQHQRWSLMPGEAALDTLRLEAQFSVPLKSYPKAVVLHYWDDYLPDQFGWKEIWIRAANEVEIRQTNVARHDRSRSLSEYTLPLGDKPPNELYAEAELVFSSLSADPSQPPEDTAQTGSELPARVPHTITSPASNQPGPDKALPPVSMPLPAWFTQQAWPFFKLGVHHIAIGLDHLVFLLGLLLLSRSLSKIIMVVTAFTLAHSLTLALAANGWVTPPTALVEAAIALTIAYVGLLGLLRSESRHSAWLAFGFGLVHGFGFAGVFAETLNQQTPNQDNWLISLASFNVGIEVFQILLVCLSVPLLRWAANYPWFYSARQVASIGVLGAGLTWFFTRTIAI